MSTYDWGAVAHKVDATIQKYGQNGSLRPETGEDIPARFISALFDQQERDGEMIQSTDIKVYLSAVGIPRDPTITDRLVIGGTARRIVSVDPVSPAGTPVCYILQVR